MKIKSKLLIGLLFILLIIIAFFGREKYRLYFQEHSKITRCANIN